MSATTVFFDLGDTLVFNNAAAVSTRFDDALDTLQMLHERGYRIGLLSNQAAGTTLAQVQARLAGLGLARWIDAALVTISTEVAGNLGKPAQPIFNLALSSYRVDKYNVAVSVANAATNILAGPTNESSQTVSFTVSNNNSGLFLVPPSVTAGGTLAFTPSAMSTASWAIRPNARTMLVGGCNDNSARK